MFGYVSKKSKHRLIKYFIHFERNESSSGDR